MEAVNVSASAPDHQGLTAPEREMLRQSIRGYLTAHWPVGQALDQAQDPNRVTAVWQGLAEMGLTDLRVGSAYGGLSAGLLLASELGAAACPAPIPAMAAAGYLLDGAADGAGTLERIRTGEVLPAIAFGSHDPDDRSGELNWEDGALNGCSRFVELPGPASMIIAAVDDGIAVVEPASKGLTVTATPGLAVPPLADIAYDAAPALLHPLSQNRIGDALTIMRLFLAARAHGAASRAHLLVVEHVRERKQFGQPLGRFQAVQQKLADCHVALTACGLAIESAGNAIDVGDADWRFLSRAAIALSASRLRKVSLETHHAFGAIGYAEEHEGPHHFRRVHADLTRYGGARSARAALAAQLIESDKRELPAQRLSPAGEEFRREVRAWLDENLTEEIRSAERGKPFKDRGWNVGFAKLMGAAGLIGVSWPKEHGGQQRSPAEQFALVQELASAEAPTISCSAASWIVGPEILRHGSEPLKAALLPTILSGEASFALAYSEAEAGSDLAALRTRATPEGDSYRISGQKLWGTGTDKASYVLLAARTNPEATPPHAGISLFVVPLDLPGITITPNMAMYGHTFSVQFYDDVAVPAANRLGPENGGWAILSAALATERILIGGAIARIGLMFNRILAEISSSGIARDAVVRDMVGEYAAEVVAARQLSMSSIEALEDGRMPLVEGAITKLFSGDLAERFSEAALDIFGTVALLGEEAPEARLSGLIEQELRRSIMLVIGGGAAEIQRSLIAQRGLGLPR